MKEARVLLWMVLSMVLAGRVAAATRHYPVYFTEGPVAPDGRLDEPAWAGAPTGTDFFPWGDGRNVQRTEFRILYDAANLYVGIRLHEADMAAQVLGEVDDGRVWANDSVEIFLQPSDRKYYRVGVNALGRRSDSTVAAGARRGDREYLLEIRIPFASLPEDPAPGSVMRGNICRNTFTRDPARHSSWAPVVEGFGEPHNFAAFVLRPPSARTAQDIEQIDRFVNLAYSPAVIEGARQQLTAPEADSGPARRYLEYIRYFGPGRRSPAFWEQDHRPFLAGAPCPAATGIPMAEGSPVGDGPAADTLGKPVVDVGRQVYEPTDAVVTPHIRWAVPYASGRLRALFIDDVGKMREVVEFAQRLDLQYAFFGSTGSLEPYYLRGGYYEGDEPGAKLARLRKLVKQEYDLIVLGNISWARFPPFARAQLVDKVRRGAGLIRIVSGHRGASVDDLLKEAARDRMAVPESVVSGVPWQALPVFAGFDSARAFLSATLEASRCGKGRFVRIKGYKPPDDHILSPGFVADPLWHRWSDLYWVRDGLYRQEHADLTMPITDIKLLDYDYNLAWLIRVMLFAARREPVVLIQDTGLVREVDREGLDAIEFTIACSKPLESKNLTARFVLRDRDNRIQCASSRATLPLEAGTRTITIPVDPVPAGDYFADLWIEREGATLGFGSLALKVGSRTGIGKVTLGADHFARDETVTGHVVIAGERNDDLRLVVRQEDGLGRLVRVETLPVTGRRVRLALAPLPDPLAVWQFLQVELVAGAAVLDRRRAAFTLSDLYLTDSVRLGAWQLGRMSYKNFHVYRELYRHGFDSTGCFIGIVQPYHDFFGMGPRATFKIGRFEMATLANLRFMPPIARVADYGLPKWAKHVYLDHEGREKLDPRPHVRHPCVNDPRYLDLMAQRVRAVVAHYGPHSTSEYFFDQEPCFSQPWHREGVCFCTHCLQFFRAHARRQYGTIAALNAAYGTDYADFSEVRGITFEQAGADRTLGPQWIDYRRAMAASFDTFYRHFTDIITSLQSAARTGDCAAIYSGFRSGEAADMWQLGQWRKASFPYPRPTGQIAMDFARPDSLVGRGCWWGPARSRSRPFARWHPWNDLFEGANFWHCYYGDTSCLLANDLSLFEDLKPRMAEFREIKGGVGQMLHAARRGHSGVAVLYSVPSMHQWTLTEAWGDVDVGSASYGRLASRSYHDNTATWINLLSDVVGPFRFVSCSELADGMLTRDGFRLLVLPWSQALSAAETAAIKGFVHAGGMVVADLRPGVTDEHGRPCATGPLDELFGVVQDTSAPRIRSTPLVFARQDAEPAPIPGKVDLTLQLRGGTASATAADAVPIIVKHATGQGRTVLLNFGIDAYLDRDELSRTAHAARSRHAPALERLFRDLLHDIRAARLVRCRPELPGLRHHTFTSGSIRYVGLLQNMPEPWADYAGRSAAPVQPTPLTVTFDEPAHVYDVRRAEYRGRTHSVPLQITPGLAQLFALLPYAVTAVEVSAPDKVTQGDTVPYRVRLRTTAAAENHVLRLSVFAPDGAELRHYARTVNAPEGRYAGSLLLALNEAPGTYGLRVRDTATGLDAERNFTVDRRRAH